MVKKTWVQESRKTLVCVDSYENSVLQGRFFDAWQDTEAFGSLAQFLIRMEHVRYA